MAKHAPQPDPSKFWAWIRLIVTLAVVAALIYAIRLAVNIVNEFTTSTKKQLQDRGVHISKDGVAVKTDKRAMTMEETEDRLQRSIMKGWKATTFEVPWVLQKTTHLGGSSHDKNKSEYENKYGAKPAKNRVD
ncbi:hypothetical protein JCM1841_000297 [Sporobolomyces salmonicolor]